MNKMGLQWGSQKHSSVLFIRIPLEFAGSSTQAVKLLARSPYINPWFKTHPLVRDQMYLFCARMVAFGAIYLSSGKGRRHKGGSRACRWTKEPRSCPPSARRGPKARSIGRIYTAREKRGEEGA